VYFVQKLSGVFVRFRAPLHLLGITYNENAFYFYIFLIVCQ
jgi:hypothetical protein